jgi:molybdopterin-guanine dinucleotide biosynthesis protein A
VTTGLILAGGESSRMGKDKAMLTLGGETLLERTQRALDSLMDGPAHDCSVFALHMCLGVSTLPVGRADAASFINCNTPAQWQEATQ